MRCQKTYFLNGHCRNDVFGASKWCRWHKIVEEFRSDLQRRPRLAAHGLMFGSSLATLFAISSVQAFLVYGFWSCLVFAILGLALTIILLADGFIAQDHPFGQLALWGKLLAVGMLVETLAGIFAGIYLLANRSEATALIRLTSDSPLWWRLGPSVFSAGCFLMAGLGMRMSITRLWFIRKQRLIVQSIA